MHAQRPPPPNPLPQGEGKSVGTTMTETLLLLVPLAAAALLAAVSDYRLSARINVAASLLSFLCALVLLVDRPAIGPFLLVDDLNVVFILLNTFVGFTTSAFSASYIGHEVRDRPTSRLATCDSITSCTSSCCSA